MSEIFMNSLLQDVRYALRQLRKNPGFTLVAMLTLALGIGANTAIFTVVNGILLKPLPYASPDQLLMVWEKQLSDGSLGTVSPGNFYDWRQQSHSFEKMAAIDAYPDFILNGTGEPQRLAGAAVSSDFFSLFGTHMLLGRDFLADEDRPGNNQVVVLSYASWQRYFGGRLDIVGHPLTLNNTAYTVVGVLPRGFSFVSKAADFQSRNQFDLWTPLALASPPPAWQRGTHPLHVFARLKAGVPLQQAQTDLNQIAANLQLLYPAEDKERGIAAIPMRQHVIADVRVALFALLATVGMVLLIACANITNLLLGRAETRRQEIAVRVALGASRKRIARQLITESMVLAGGGALLAVFLVVLSVPTLVRYLPADLPRTSEITVDWRVLIFTTAVSLVTGVVFGLVPLFHSRRVSANDELKQGGRGFASGKSGLRGSLIVGQVAISLVLLVGAGLMTKSFWMLLRVSPGFHTDHILTAQLSLPPRYSDGDGYGTGKHHRTSVFLRNLDEKIQQIPGVQSAGFAAYLPLSGRDNSWSFTIEGRPPQPAGVFDNANYRPVSARYFDTIGISILRGRGFDAHDSEDSPPVVIINQSMARMFWQGADPIGQRIHIDAVQRTIVGMVGDVLHQGLDIKPEPEMYIPYEQAPNIEARPTIILRTSIEPGILTSELRKAVSDVDAGVPMDHVETMEQIVSGSLGQSRFRTIVLLMFALLALFVASTGLYGVISYLVTQRVREFGIRMALGASRLAVLRLVLGQSASLVGIGICLGLCGAALLSRTITSLLYGVSPFDIATLASMSILLVSVALVASYVPARRAARIEPMVALRYE